MIKIESHNVEMEDFTFEVLSTIDHPKNETFTPSVLFVSGKTKVVVTLPPQPYVNGSWTDTDVEQAIAKYIDEIKTL